MIRYASKSRADRVLQRAVATRPLCLSSLIIPPPEKRSVHCESAKIIRPGEVISAERLAAASPRGVTARGIYMDGEPYGSSQSPGAIRRVSNAMGYVCGKRGPCQFYVDGACAVWELRPTLCRISPVEIVFAHDATESVVVLGYNESQRLWFPSKPTTGSISVGEWLDREVSRDEMAQFVMASRKAAGWR